MAGWAGDRAHPDALVEIAVFADGRLLGLAIRDRQRTDVGRVLGIPAWEDMSVGFSIVVPAPCQPDRPPTVVAFTADHRFAVLPGPASPPASCPG